MQMNDLESRKMITQRLDVNEVLDKLFKLDADSNYDIYTLLSQYDTEILLFMMAKTDNKKTKKLISVFFTKLKSTKILIKGRELKEMGFKPGPLYKEIFNRLLEARLNGKVNTKKDEISFVRENFEGHLV